MTGKRILGRAVVCFFLWAIVTPVIAADRTILLDIPGCNT